ncbi:MAG: ATP-binding protein [Rhodospirillales bacterium]|nr:ATP-binding protein [Rhodospirillales bacterium]
MFNNSDGNNDRAGGAPAEGPGALKNYSQELLNEIQKAGESLLKSMFDKSNQGVLINRNMRALYANQALADIYGYETPAEILALESTRLLVDPEDSQYSGEQHHARIRGDSVPLDNEYRGRRKDGTEVWIEKRSFPIEWDGKSAICTFRFDITARKRAEEEARKSQERLINAIESISDGFVLFDKDGKLVLSNNRYRDLLSLKHNDLQPGMTLEDIVRLRVARGLIPEAIGREDDYVRERIVLHDTEGEKTELKLSSGRWVLCADHRTKEGETVSIRRDVTELKEREEALKRARDELESRVKERTWELTQEISERKLAEKRTLDALAEAKIANRTKSEFLANMSHELRTPLNAVIGFSDALKMGVFGPLANEKQADYLDNIHQSGTHLLDLINDILDVSTIEAGMLELRKENIDISSIAESVLKMVKTRADAREIKLISDIKPDLPKLWVDERRFKQILLNLLSNGIKFSAAGSEVKLVAENINDDHICLSIIDMGIGMDDQDIDVALRPFDQVDSRLARKYEGTGLGLPLSKSLVEAHGGTLEIISKKGNGTTARVSFPLARDRIRA